MNLPIPLTCRPEVVVKDDGRKMCVQSFDTGACSLDNQFMCPYYLAWEKENPEALSSPVPYHILRQVRNREPIPELRTFGDENAKAKSKTKVKAKTTRKKEVRRTGKKIAHRLHVNAERTIRKTRVKKGR